MNAQTIRDVFPSLPADKAVAYSPLLVAAMREGNITTEPRAAAFLAQLGHESIDLRYFEEIGPQPYWKNYSGGARYHGRGPIQLTHDYNYKACGKALGLPLLEQPELAARPENGFRVAVWFWVTHGLNGLADKGRFRAICVGINGGVNGLTDRFARWNRIRKLGDEVLPIETREQKWIESRGRKRESLRSLLLRRRQLRAEHHDHGPVYEATTRMMRKLKVEIERLTRLISREQAKHHA
ncbi:MAG: glycoside hydrolase family 19 protein [Thermoleophilaceae bacterium]